MEQVQSNDVNMNGDSSDEESIYETIDLTENDETYVFNENDETYVFNETADYEDLSQESFLDEYMSATDVIFHSWSNTSYDFMENSSSISDEDMDSSSPTASDSDTIMSYVIYQDMEAAASNNDQPLDEDMNGESSTSTPQFILKGGSSNSSSISSHDETDDNDMLHSMADNEYALEFESQLGTINDVEQAVHVEHVVQHDVIAEVPEVSFVSLVSEDEDEDGTRQLIPQERVRAVVNFDNIFFIPSLGELEIFPFYNQTVFEEIKTLMEERCNIENEVGRHIFSFGVDDLMKIFSGFGWLNDLLIDAYLELIVSNCNGVHYFGCYFVANLKARKYNFERNRTNHVDLFSFDKILFPINPNKNHWALVMVEPSKREITYYNSFPEKPVTELNLIVEFLSKYCAFRYPIMKPYQWRIRNGESPEQSNTYDCGIFTCTNARYISFNKPLQYTQTDIPLARQRITYELLCNIVIPFSQ